MPPLRLLSLVLCHPPSPFPGWDYYWVGPRGAGPAPLHLLSLSTHERLLLLVVRVGESMNVSLFVLNIEHKLVVPLRASSKTRLRLERLRMTTSCRLELGCRLLSTLRVLDGEDHDESSGRSRELESCHRIRWKIENRNGNDEGNDGGGDDKGDCWQDGVVLDLVQDAAPYRELRGPVLDTAPLRYPLILFKTLLHPPRLQSSDYAKWLVIVAEGGPQPGTPSNSSLRAPGVRGPPPCPGPESHIGVGLGRCCSAVGSAPTTRR